ncbi:hypothetical protein AVEN_129300-1 [Araneus ventricosus]|uniref:Uncharacterized protein n=1 Tax=Araneus ventricosus TaxID=182803 RepID=A0A4Y2MPD1_ARAVE|nr:hypothetical protein AVEN_129300-1 [Araneus ventricosus]
MFRTLSPSKKSTSDTRSLNIKLSPPRVPLQDVFRTSLSNALLKHERSHITQATQKDSPARWYFHIARRTATTMQNPGRSLVLSRVPPHEVFSYYGEHSLNSAQAWPYVTSVSKG